ncbi:unnamed protein product [Miscanthus lutarioriparius]|uniref:O-methyltransferase C-terminal domain-containing protein n=1 Tax=Miscanthus lutarioriparius TaxID=422564 RepID=A0A811PHU7_9POAL|nr:unnamed protein product [Miscanthus lutarioriparius]
MSPAEGRLAMMELANMVSVPMALTAVIRLGIPDAIWAGGANAPMSVGRTLVPEGASGASYADYVLQHHQDALVAAWPRLHEAVLDPRGPELFARANAGVPAYAYYGKDREANQPFMDALLDGYGPDGGFRGVAKLVDVGRSSVACLEMIMRRVPTIKEGINFDLPDVVADAPPIAASDKTLPYHTGYGRCARISAKASDQIPRRTYRPSQRYDGSAWVLTTWTNDECTTILRNCHAALPDGGKLVACEPVVPEQTDTSTRTVMTTYRTQGRERSEELFRHLGVTAGFTAFRAIYLDPFYAVLEYTK